MQQMKHVSFGYFSLAASIMNNEDTLSSKVTRRWSPTIPETEQSLRSKTKVEIYYVVSLVATLSTLFLLLGVFNLY